MTQSMYRNSFFTLIIIFLFCTVSKGQKKFPSHIDSSFFCWTPTTKNKVVQGVAIGLTAHPWSSWDDTIFVKVNGVNLEVEPFGIIGGVWGTMYGLIGINDENGNRLSFFSNHGYDSLSEIYTEYGTHINGLSISIGGIDNSYNHGIIFNGLSGFSHEIKGFQFSGLINTTVDLKGVSVAGLANVATKANGIQIGLINKCKTGNVLQLGLFNRIGKRVIPFINFRIKKTK